MERLQRALNHRAIRLLGPLLGLICSAVFISRLDLPEVGAAFNGLAWYWLAPVLLFGCLNLWLRAVRWGVLLAPAAPLPTAQLLGIGISAGLAGLGLPARGGDAVNQLNTGLRTVFQDLVERRLWPVALVLVVALIAIPVLLWSPASDTAGTSATPVPPAAPATGSPIAAIASHRRSGSNTSAPRRRFWKAAGSGWQQYSASWKDLRRLSISPRGTL